jgi:hypothetical protein
MDRAEALQALPPSYAIALRLLDAGVEPDAVARVLDVEPEAVGPLLTPAEAKVAGITGSPAGLDVGTERAEEALDSPGDY